MKKTLLYISSVILVSLTIYGLLWGFIYWHLNKEIDAIYLSAKEQNITILGKKPSVTGFPGKPKIFFAGALQKGPYVLSLPELYLEGFMLPGQDLRLFLPQGSQIAGVPLEEALSISLLDVHLEIPSNIPSSLKAKDLTEWQKNEGLLHIPYLKVQHDTQSVLGHGFIQLDKNLQPEIEFYSEIYGYDAFLKELQDKNLIQKGQVIALKAILSAMATTDPKNNKKYLKLPITVQDQKLRIGSIVFGSLPTIEWSSE